MRAVKIGSPLLLCVLLSSAACQRIAADDEVPEWLFDVYSNLPVTTTGDKAVSRYTFFEDHRVELELDLGCGGQTVSWELRWEERAPNELTLRQVSESEDLLPGSDLYSEWVLSYSGECGPIELYGIRKADGVQSYAGQLYRGAVCSAQVPPPDDWGGGEWNECEWFWCEMPSTDSCGP